MANLSQAKQQGTPDPSKPTKLPAIPEPAAGNLVQVVSAIKELLEVRENRRPNTDPLDQNITLRDLVDNGLASYNLNGRQLGNDPSAGNPILPPAFNPAIPPAITGLTASGAMTSIVLTWDQPTYGTYGYTEIWRSGTDDLGTAVLVGQSPGNIWTDAVGADASFYYWVRAVSHSTPPVTGPYNGTAGTTGQTSPDPAYLISQLSGQINQLVLDNAGYISGYSLLDQDGKNYFIVRADTFALVPPNTAAGQNGTLPFIVDSGNVYINTAFIKDASITSAKIGSLAADKITTGTMAADRIGAGTIKAQQVFLGSGRFQLDGVNSKIWVSDTNNVNRVELGNLGSGGYGLILRDANGNVFLNSGGVQAVPASVVSGLGNFATLNQISASNASTYLSSAAIGTAFIVDAAITNAKIGNAAVDTLKIAGQAVTVPAGQGFIVNVAGNNIQRDGNGGYTGTLNPGSRTLTFTITGTESLSFMISVFAKQGNSSLDNTQCVWWSQLVVDGTVQTEAGGYIWVDTFTLGWPMTLAPGSHSITINWGAQGTGSKLQNYQILAIGTRR